MVDAPNGTPPVPPHAPLCAATRAVARRLETAGRAAAARELRRVAEAGQRERQARSGGLPRRLDLHHDIKNALAGVRGDTRLLLVSLATQVPGATESLKAALRESDRIREATHPLDVLKTALTAVVHESDSASASRAA